MSFLNQVLTHKIRTFKTFMLCVGFVTIGMNISSTGPYMLDFQILVNSTLKEVASILPARSFGYAAGSISCGLVYKFVDVHMLVILFLTFSMITVAWIPYNTNILLLWVAFFANGYFNGGFDNVSNSWIIYMWGSHNGPFLQILHLSFGIGCFLFPFYLQNFILPSENLNCTLPEACKNEISFTYKDVKMHYSYWTIAGLHLATILTFIFLYIKQPTNKPHSTLEWFYDQKKGGNRESKSSLPFIAISMVFFFLLIGLEVSFGSLLPAFAVKSNLRLDKSTGTYISSAYWSTFTFFRIVTIVLLRFFTCTQIIILDIGLIVIADIILTPFANNYEWALWLGSLIMGAGISSLFPSMFTNSAEVINVTPLVTSSFTIASCLGALCVPSISGYFLNDYPKVILYSNVICTIFIIGTFIVICKLKTNYLNKDCEC